VVYNLLMMAAAETPLAVAADPKRLGARIGVTAALHTWGAHPSSCPGGRLSLDGARMGRRALQLPRACQRAGAPVLGQDAGDAHACAWRRRVKFFNTHAGLDDKRTFKSFIAPLRRIK
jgi:hypothetical protein